MIAALSASAAFLASYLFYHFHQPSPVRYQGEGILRLVYFFILGTHTPLAVLIIPCAASAVYFALRGDFSKHTRITRWLLPVWLYVSATGILIYLMLYVF